jgi:hypothetical protein
VCAQTAHLSEPLEQAACAKQFKLPPAQHKNSRQDFLVEAINGLLAKHWLSRIA